MSVRSIFRPVEGREPLELLLLSVALLFVGLNALALGIALDGAPAIQHLWAPALWAVLMGLSHWLLNRFRPRRDSILLPIYALLTGWGLLLVDRLAPNFLARQALWMVLATVALLAIAILPRNLSMLRRYRYTWLTLGLILLVATLIFGVNPSGAGAALWLRVPILSQIYFQPSELMKLLLIVFLASYFDEHAQLEPFRQEPGGRGHAVLLAPLLLMWGFCMVLLIWQRDLGAATLFFVTFLTLLYIATGEWRYAVGGFLLL
ncbi:MAG TPA: FtsW/RodA/SpoVE family cell cycle protein, partial [Candidatus Binatia bacterium]|nr:FtsW/RodA/SpoVE family cell cycle protein [Candidatus Binatia bacterium]